MVGIEPVIVIHIQSRISKRNVQLGSWRNYHMKYELKFLETMMEMLGADRCHIMD